ncbi:hypothetical protein A3BBH6_23260 [Alistipes onderdonkii subsp. vulgaris]|nr:hypothetical protein A3BBH6_23260 [Alistipes onderdonkii subsp. vulgaris]
MVALEHTHNIATLYRVIACNDECRSFSCWQKASVRQTFPAAELSKLPVESPILKKESIESLGLDVRHQGKHHNDPLIK